MKKTDPKQNPRRLSLRPDAIRRLTAEEAKQAAAGAEKPRMIGIPIFW